MPYAYTNLSASTAAVTNRFVTTTNMKVGEYTLANATAAHGAGFKVTATITAVTGNDTPGTLVVVGIGMDGQPLTETITLAAGTGGNGSKIFRSLTSVTGAGWVINVGNDTIVVGNAADAYITDGPSELYAVVVNSTTATSIALATAGPAVGTLKASIAENTYYYQCVVSTLRVTHAGTSNYTIIHTPSLSTRTAS
jgi:hypothetical protein